MQENIIEHWLDMGYKEESRRIRVLLPKNYNADRRKRYPVLYFQDGQNIFYDEESYSGISWGIIETLRDNEDLADFIVVAVDNSNARMQEYSSWNQKKDYLSEKIDIEGKQYADFFINKVKTFVDENYRTKKACKYTTIIGSSAGANINSYIGLEYGKYVGKLGIFSLASWIFDDSYKKYINNSKANKKQKVYIVVGTSESEISLDPAYDHFIRQAYIDSSISFFKNLIKKGLNPDNIVLRICEGGEHNEYDWAKYLYDCLKFLTNDWN